ncbi:DUF932 domain-containing protein [Actinopolyspora halophila]|uniref:DUF932 domain-containing protein n=1 Tax=Actinopolyspora halophila TaxID=1850 RepID=UPI000372FE93|nr:DUF932 domain-containing protein [Actinopolyspora halophila]
MLADSHEGRFDTSAVPGRRNAWQQLGETVDDCATAHQALRKAGLTGWNIRKLEQSATELAAEGVTRVNNPHKVMLVRDHPHTGRPQYLSTVGRDYGIRQNEEQARVLDTLVAESGAGSLAQAGSLNGGRLTFVTMRLPNTMHVAGVDPMEFYLTVFNSHDGSSAFRVMIVPFRVSCANQLNVALHRSVSEVSIRHTSNAKINIEDVRTKLGLMYDYVDAFETEARRMIDHEMTTEEFGEVVNTVWPVDDNASERTRNNARRRWSTLSGLFGSAETQHAIRGTRWAGWQAITEYLDHHQPAKTPDVRAQRVLTSAAVADRKQRAFELLTS